MADTNPFTIDVSDADRALDATIDHTLRMIRESDAKLAELEEEYRDDEVTDEDVERFKAYITGFVTTEEWRRVMEKIAHGELTWREVVEDSGKANRDVAAAMRSLQRVAPLDEAAMSQLAKTLTVTLDAEAAEQAQAPEEPDHSDYFADAQDEADWLDDNSPPWR